MKNFYKYLRALLIAAAISVFCALTALAAGERYSEFWYQDQAGVWHIRDGAGNMVKNAWLCDDAVPENGKDIWYLIDPDGRMISAGLVQDGTGNCYSLEMDHNGHYGMLRYISGTYTSDGLKVELSLEGSHAGSFAAIRNADGISLLREKYGLRTVDIDNANCVYTSSFVKSGDSSKDAPAQLTVSDFTATGSSVPASDLIGYITSLYDHDAAAYFYYDSSEDTDRGSVIRTARGITLASSRSDVINAYGAGTEISVADPSGTKVLEIAYGYDPQGVRSYLRSCLAYRTPDGKYAIYFGFKESGQISYIFYYVA